MKRLFSPRRIALLMAGLAFPIASLSCADPPYRTEVTSSGQGSVELKRVPVEKRPKPAEQISAQQQRIADLEAQVQVLQAENVRLREAAAPKSPTP